MSAQTSTAWAFATYQAVRHRLPQARFPAISHPAPDLTALIPSHDIFLLDAFGVLNVGEAAIPGAVDHVSALQQAGKHVMVVSNAAGYPKRLLMTRLARLGFDFNPDQVLSSREVLLHHLHQWPPLRWGLMADPQYGLEELDGLHATILGDDPQRYDEAEGFAFLGSGTWTDHRQRLLTDSLHRRPRPVLVGNPDIVAPREGGLSLEPGHYAHLLADQTGTLPQFFGKPYPAIFDMALTRARAARADVTDPARIVMVGDTLHTDILGGAAAGVQTALITGFGALVGMDVQSAITASGITPDLILPQP
ncbi:MAG: HAD family hydrolase [Rhodobacterales bacterium 34-62-10]|nr:MAG: HAD family hydrolase [Rhodobacterales bacterium 34-62-10]